MPRRDSSTRRGPRGADWRSRWFDAGLLACLFVAPLFLGGRHDAGRLVYAVAVGVTAVGLGLRSRGRPAAGWLATPAALACAAAIGVVTLQITPLPSSWVEALTPGRQTMLPAWSVGDHNAGDHNAAGAEAGAPFGGWRTLSLNPYATRVGLAVLLAHVALFWSVAGALRSEHDIRRLLTLVGLAAAAMAVVGLVQHVFSNDRLLGIYEHPHRRIGALVQGTFYNRNHFAQFVVLGIAPLIGLALMKAPAGARGALSPGRRRGLLLALSVVASAAVLMSLSRGGGLSLLAALALAGLLFWRAGVVRLPRLALAGGVGAAAVVAILSVHNYQDVAARFDDFASGSLDTLDRGAGRRNLWLANLQAQAASPWFGYGVGSHRDVYHAFFESPHSTEFTHCESSYLHLATECGLVAAAVAGFLIALVACWVVGGWRAASTTDQRVMWGMIAPGLLASLVHSVVDFVWFIPSCACLVVLTAAAAMRLASLQSAPAKAPARPQRMASKPAAPVWSGLGLGTMGRWAPLASSAVAVVLLLRPAWASVPWDAYLRDSVASRRVAAEPAGSADEAQLRIETRRFLRERSIGSLEETLRRAPGHPRAHARLAAMLIERFEDHGPDEPNPLGVAQVNEAALASRFASRRETEGWLRRAFPHAAEDLVHAHRHALAAVLACPLQATAYQMLIELRFLAPPDQRDQALLDRQALALRPHDGRVLFNAGRRRMIDGRHEEAARLWRDALRRPGGHRAPLVALLRHNMTAADLLAAFEPEGDALRLVTQAYGRSAGPDDLAAVADYSVAIAQRQGPLRSDAEAAWLWLSAAHAAKHAGREEQRHACAAEAYRLAPSVYRVRGQLAAACLATGRFAEAEPHLRWCLARRPDASWLREGLLETARHRRAAADSTTR